MTRETFHLPQPLLAYIRWTVNGSSDTPESYILRQLRIYAGSPSAQSMSIPPVGATLTEKIDLDIAPDLRATLERSQNDDTPLEKIIRRALNTQLDDADRSCTESLEIRLCNDTYERIVAIAKAANCSTYSVIRRALRNYFFARGSASIPNDLIGLPDVMTADNLPVLVDCPVPAYYSLCAERMLGTHPDGKTSYDDTMPILARAVRIYAIGTASPQPDTPPAPAVPYTPPMSAVTLSRKLRL